MPSINNSIYEIYYFGKGIGKQSENEIESAGDTSIRVFSFNDFKVRIATFSFFSPAKTPVDNEFLTPRYHTSSF